MNKIQEAFEKFMIEEFGSKNVCFKPPDKPRSEHDVYKSDLVTMAYGVFKKINVRGNKAKESETCEWVITDCCWKTKCGKEHHDHAMWGNFCPYCGGKIVEKGKTDG